ncbi:MAG: DMT family transporter [Desulfuromonadaceae bacterium]|nr:DMT family transporter [Desulfuromonadaceae bacterium]
MDTKADRRRLLGLVFAALSAASFGIAPIFARIAYDNGLNTTTAMFLRFAIAGTIMTAFFQWQKGTWPRGRNLFVLLLMGGICYLGQSFCYYSALHYASAGLVALLLYLYPAIVTVILALITRSKLGPVRTGALVAALAGTALTVSGSLKGSLLGVTLGIGAALIYSTYIVLGDRMLGEESVLGSTTVILLTAAAVYGIIIAWQGPSWPASTAGWGAATALALTTVGGVFGFLAGIQRLGAVDASTVSTLEPVTTIALAAVFLEEFIRLRQIVGGIVILAAVILLIRHGVPKYINTTEPL